MGRPKKPRHPRGRPFLTAQQLMSREGSVWINPDLDIEPSLEEEMVMLERPQPSALKEYWDQRRKLRQEQELEIE